jgi:hypothetical protein
MGLYTLGIDPVNSDPYDFSSQLYAVSYVRSNGYDAISL